MPTASGSDDRVRAVGRRAHQGATMSTVVTGGTGFLGSAVVRRLSERGDEVVALGSADHDLTEQADVRRLFAELRPRRIVHAAAAVGGIGANVAEPGRFLTHNALMGLLLLEEARHAGVERFVLISTGCAYPESAPLPLREDDLWEGRPTGATGPYGLAKRLLHEAIVRLGEQYGFPGVTLVLANLYGPGDRVDAATGHVVPSLILRYAQAVATGAREVTNWGTGTPTREFLHIDDAARAVVAALDAHAPGTDPMNIGTGVETRLADVADLVADLVGFTGVTTWDATRPDGQPRRVFDVTRARERLGFEATIDLASGLASTVDAFRRDP